MPATTSQISATPVVVPSREKNDALPASQFAYSFGTLVTDKTQYQAMVTSCGDAGFIGADCEFLYIDNMGEHQTCAFNGLNAILNAARSEYVILCHQDIRLNFDDRKKLDECLSELGTIDSNWALAGNAGGIAAGKLALRITDPHGENQHIGEFPQKVMSLDENFIVVRAKSRASFSNNLSGFHFYGADICLNANTMGWNSYVIDFHLAHLSGGNKDKSFAVMQKAFQDKWNKAISPRWMQTTCALLRLSGSSIDQLASSASARPLAKIGRLLAASKIAGGPERSKEKSA